MEQKPFQADAYLPLQADAYLPREMAQRVNEVGVTKAKMDFWSMVYWFVYLRHLMPMAAKNLERKINGVVCGHNS